MDVRFDGKRVLVTGAGKGIGRGIALKLSECGAQVIAISRTQSDLDSLKQEASDTVETHVCDLADWDATRKLVKDLGQIDLLVNNAGTSCPVPFLEVTKEILYSRFDINFMSVFNVTQIRASPLKSLDLGMQNNVGEPALLCQYSNDITFTEQVVAKSMIERGEGGAIVNISSFTAMRAFGKHSAYTCTKAAMDQLIRSLALELGPHKIRVNSVNPTVVLTPLTVKGGWSNPEKASSVTDRTSLGRFADIDDIANATVFLLSDKSMMTTGTSFMVDGGLITAI